MRQIVLVLMLIACPAAAQEPGGALFADHCASCHGAGARGDGPMAEILTVPIPDLTGLAVRAGGEFPLARVVEVIDGRTPLRGHGGPMPVFGPIFGGSAEVAVEWLDGSILTTSAEIHALAQWLIAQQR